MRRRIGKRFITGLLLLAIAATGMLVQLYATAHGAGISPDSTVYIAAAKGILDGRGIQHLSSGGDLQPLAVWAPLYPVVLASGGEVIDLLVWARILNAVLLGANLVLAGLMIAPHHRSSLLAPVIGAGLLLLSEDFVTVHAWIWTEPLAIFTGFVGLFWIDRALAASKVTALIPPALMIGLSCLIRYASLPFVAAGVLGLMMFGQSMTRLQRLRRSLFFSLMALLPILTWDLRMLDLSGRVAGRSVQFRPTALTELDAGLRIVADWVVPGRIDGEAIRTWAGGVFLLAWAAGAIALMVHRITIRKRDIASGASNAADLLTLFVLSYAGMIVATRFFLSPSVSLSPRIFSLGYMAILVGAVGNMAEVLPWIRLRLHGPGWQRWVGAGALTALAVLWAGFQLSHTAKWARQAHAGGLGYASVDWMDSPLLRYIRALPPDMPIYSNGPDAIYTLTGRPAAMLPDWPGGPATAGGPLPVAIAQMRDELAASAGVIVYFRGITWRSTLSEVELKRILPLEPLFGTDLGSIYGVEP